jgi:hypothetical protein
MTQTTITIEINVSITYQNVDILFVKDTKTKLIIKF